ncbi:hypothetical protein VB712_03250 [Spirulina sp. CCNP1310]|uniref:hypothetical protein n=1 Tax=Spirulina sp. CCNP1310 TaxID=3110249 RepID=UPI002B2003AB|nr:hypothetical protein [Spirulina sp. CCNP1310]MEA5418226.1 hypothetical protein [Spirulina sp. CCNP1310]
MVEIEVLTAEILKLSPESQQKVADFVQLLKTNSQDNPVKPTLLNLKSQNFVGMWSDRPEIQDSSQWVRNLRQNQWTR